MLAVLLWFALITHLTADHTINGQFRALGGGDNGMCCFVYVTAFLGPSMASYLPVLNLIDTGQTLVPSVHLFKHHQ